MAATQDQQEEEEGYEARNSYFGSTRSLGKTSRHPPPHVGADPRGATCPRTFRCFHGGVVVGPQRLPHLLLDVVLVLLIDEDDVIVDAEHGVENVV